MNTHLHTRRRHRRSGHTLSEMVIVGMIVALLGTYATRAWNPIGDSIVDLRERAVASSELRLAVEFLREDLGGGLKLSEPKEDVLLIKREEKVAFLHGIPLGQDDPGIRYSFEDGNLVRRDLDSNVEFIAARAIEDFKVRKVHGNKIHIELTAGVDNDQRTVTLIWLQ